eukprot:scaffold3283_cov103-Alexandrium_tamarense.AAC.11
MGWYIGRRRGCLTNRCEQMSDERGKYGRLAVCGRSALSGGHVEVKTREWVSQKGHITLCHGAESRWSLVSPLLNFQRTRIFTSMPKTQFRGSLHDNNPYPHSFPLLPAKQQPTDQKSLPNG